MKIKSICIILSLLVMMVYPSAKAAIWNPDEDPNLKFNLNFEQNKVGPPPETNDVGPSKLIGTASDYNTTDPFHMWDSNVNERKIGSYSADFRKPCDVNTGKTFDCRVSVQPSEIFDLSGATAYVYLQRTFTLWFYPDTQTAGTLIRHANGGDPNYYWEIRMYDGKLQFWSKMGDFIPLRMETTKTLAQLGVQANSWHHAAIVYDINTRGASLMFVDGVQVDKTVISHNNTISANVDPDHESPVIFGTGETEFEGMLDECRIYHRILTPSAVSILYQTDYKTHAIALSPFPNASNVPVDTNFLWVPVATATRQTFLFGTDPNLRDPCAVVTAINDDGNDMNSVTNAQVDGPLDLNTTYYWVVDTNVSGTDYNGPVWKFTTETGKAYNPVPTNGQQDVNVGSVDLQWSASSSASKFDVYFSDNFDRVNDVNADARVVQNLADLNEPNFVVSAPTKGETYYWCIVTKFPAGTGLPDVKGDVWSFRIEPQLVIVNTSDAGVIYNEVNYPAKSLTFVDTSTVVNGYLGDDDVVIFDFNSNLNLNEFYSIIVLPLFDNLLEADMNSQGHRKTSRPMAIHVNGDASFNCRIEAYAFGASTIQGGPSSKARSGGYRGSFRNEDHNDPIEKFGPGYGATGPYNCGAGGGYGGVGGDQARAGGGSGGAAYGYLQVPVPLGGSAGGWGNGSGGGGGGAVEIAATGNVTLGAETQLLANGGDANNIAYAAGGGAGGSVRIIAGGNFTNSGVVDANGGKGGDTTQIDEPKNTGGGGGGGRVAIFHGGSYTAGQIGVAGGARGGRPEEDQNTPSQPGASGTIYESNQPALKPDIPTPADGANGIISGGKVTLKWYPGFGAKTNELYFGTSANPPKIMEVNGVPAKGGVLRAQQSYDVNATAGQTYYWYVKATSDTNEVNSTTWSFFAIYDYVLLFNTSDVNTVKYGDVNIAPLTCREKNATGWVTAPVATGSVDANGNIAVFNFASGFNYDRNYSIIVVPEFTCTGRSSGTSPTIEEPNILTRRPLAIRVTGDFYFDGTLDISGDDVLVATNRPKARSGGFRGPRKRSATTDDMDTYSERKAGYFATVASGLRYNRYSRDPNTIRGYDNPTDPCGYNVFGPGVGSNIIDTVEAGSGGGYGGYGGDSGRNYWFGLSGGGRPYGDKEVPIPFGGSAGAYGKESPGGAGGGGVEIVATGSVTFGSNAGIYSEGGSVLFVISRYTGGGGAGGSVKVIAGGNFTNNGIIDVNGGAGGSQSVLSADNGGGGSGGRVSVYYGGTYTNNGQITAKGGAKGRIKKPGDPNDQTSIAESGQDGTIFTSNGSPRKASAPTPRNGDKLVYAPTSPTALTLKWYSGYNVTAANDIVYFDQNPNPATKVGEVPATRGQKSVSVNVNPNQTYYFKVVTGGSVSSDVWSFKTVNWQCTAPYDSVDANNYQPTWDIVPNDCVVNFNDLWYFAKDWRNSSFGSDYMLEWTELWVLMDQWLECRGRTNSGCTGW